MDFVHTLALIFSFLTIIFLREHYVQENSLTFVDLRAALSDLIYKKTV